MKTKKRIYIILSIICILVINSTSVFAAPEPHSPSSEMKDILDESKTEGKRPQFTEPDIEHTYYPNFTKIYRFQYLNKNYCQILKNKGKWSIIKVSI